MSEVDGLCGEEYVSEQRQDRKHLMTEKINDVLAHFHLQAEGEM